MARRREERIIISLPVRLWGMDVNGKPFTQNASSVDITRMGARIQGVTAQIQHGDIIGVQHGSDKARFRVIWVARPGSRNEGQIGVHCVEANKYIWGTVEPSNQADTWDPEAASASTHAVGAGGGVAAVMAASPSHKDNFVNDATREGRRRMPRYACRGGGEIRQPGMKTVVWGSMTDISRSGCYLETLTTLPRNAKCELMLNVEGIEVRAGAEVRVSHPSMGMGLQFIDVDPTDQKKLDDLLVKLAGGKEPEDRIVHPVSNEFATAIASAASQLRDLEACVSENEENVDPRLLSEFRSAVDHARSTTAAIEQWVDLQEQDRDPFPVLAAIETSRIRLTASFMRELVMDIDAATLHLGSEGVKELYEAARQLHLRIEQMIADATEPEDLLDADDDHAQSAD
ncbi:PilZ domain-containing protein [Candidatus Korobacter versatilis]|nr:PilZ domain-containing protein [Candidatus Koribacter versatilis]